MGRPRPGRTRSALRLGLVWTVATTLLVPAGTGAAAVGGRGAASVAMIDLGTLGGPSAYPTALNDRGQVIGSSTLPDGSIHAFLWQRGRMADLGTLGGPTSVAVGLNERGQVVGQAMRPDGTWRAFLWDRGRMRDLGTLGGSFSTARAISDRGLVVGESTDAAGRMHAFAWRDGVMTDLTPTRPASHAEALNDRGDVVGYAQNGLGRVDGFRWRRGMTAVLSSSDLRDSVAVDVDARGEVAGRADTDRLFDSHAYLWSADGQPHDLGALGGRRSYATAINDDGQVVGYSETPSGRVHAFVWSHGVMSDLGVLVPDGQSIAEDVNDRSQVVGRGSVAAPPHQTRDHAVLWEHGAVVDLGTGPGVTAEAIAVNDRGWILGQSYGRLEARGVLWRTVPAGRGG